MGFDRATEPSTEAAVAAPAPAPRPTRARGRRQVLTLGMPALSACGLSEPWLQKTCGDRHWQALAALLGRAPADWADAAGRPVYAAFGALRWQAAGDGRAAAALADGDRLVVTSRCGLLDRTQAWSTHGLATPRGPVGRLSMLSCFVSRRGDGNRTIGRVALAPDAPAAAPPAELAAWRAALREAVPADADAPALAEAGFDPCPRSDFNGAGLLYFASYGSFVDRALWGWRRLPPDARVLERTLVFRGNLEPGEALRVRLLGDTPGAAGTRRLALALHAGGDGRLLARAWLGVASPLRT